MNKPNKLRSLATVLAFLAIIAIINCANLDHKTEYPIENGVQLHDFGNGIYYFWENEPDKLGTLLSQFKAKNSDKNISISSHVPTYGKQGVFVILQDKGCK